MKRLIALLALLTLSILAADLTSFKTADNSWDDAFGAARQAGRTVTLPAGRYELSRPLDITDGLTLFFEDGAELSSAATPVIRHTGGTLILEGRGLPGLIRCTAPGERGWLTPKRAAAIDINEPSADNPPTLILRNIEIHSFNGIDGYWLKNADNPKFLNDICKNPLAALDLANCRFLCAEKGVAVTGAVIGRARIENCYFEGCDNPINLNAPIPGGILVQNNELVDFGRSGIQLGKSGQVSDGCTTHLPSAIVKGNRLLKGGRGATTRDSYIQGILVYGHNVVVEGNVVRDVNRGIPVPDAPLGHQIIAEDGTALRGHWVERNGKKVRLAGAAIYLKANRSLVMGNICTNSGYRSVIEIKTGGKEPYVSVCNNIVDGRALDIDESFGFECNSGRSVWMNNVVYDMPHEAFVVRSGYENTFLNNLIVNAKIGFGLAGSVPGQSEWLNGNRFLNVDIPVAVDGKDIRPASIPEATLPGPVYLTETTDLPAPAPEWNGRMIVKGKTVYLGIVDAGVCKWLEVKGTIVEPPNYTVTGPELAFNADQSGTAVSDNPLLNDPAFPGWQFWMRTATEKPLDPHDGFISFDTANTKTGGRSLKVLFPDFGSEWTARQPIRIQPGRRYRATAWVRGDEPRNFYLRAACGGKVAQTRGTETTDWQLLSVDFQATSASCELIIHGAKTSPGKASWIDSVSLRELVEEGTFPLADLHTTGPELLPQPHADNNRLAKGWSAAGANCTVSEDADGLRLQLTSDGNLSLSTAAALPPGSYRLEYLFADENKLLSVNVKLPDGTRPAGRTLDNRTFHCDFTLDAPGKVQLGLWGGNLHSGQTCVLRHASLKALEAAK